MHQDSYFEMSMLYYCWLLVQKHKRDKIYTLTTIYNILQYKHHKLNTVAIHHVLHVHKCTVFTDCELLWNREPVECATVPRFDFEHVALIYFMNRSLFNNHIRLYCDFPVNKFKTF